MQKWFSTNISIVAGIGSLAGMFAIAIALLGAILAHKLNLKVLLGGIILLVLFGIGPGWHLLASAGGSLGHLIELLDEYRLQ